MACKNIKDVKINATYLSGLGVSRFMRNIWAIQSDYKDWNNIKSNIICSVDIESMKLENAPTGMYEYGMFVSMANSGINWVIQIYYPDINFKVTKNQNPIYRIYQNNIWSNWKVLSNIQDL